MHLLNIISPNCTEEFLSINLAFLLSTNIFIGGDEACFGYNASLSKSWFGDSSRAVSTKFSWFAARELKNQQSIIKDKLDEMKLQHAIPLHLFKDESIEGFQEIIKEMFLGEDRVATKAYLKLFIEKIVINLPRIDITCKSSVLLAALENKTAVRSGEVLTADIFWLPSADSNHGPDG
jgi:hypothetical protein